MINSQALHLFETGNSGEWRVVSTAPSKSCTRHSPLKTRHYHFPWSILLAALFLSACGGSGSEATDTAGAVKTVGVVHPQQRSFQASLVIAGSVLPDKEVMVTARESGYVKQVLKDVGDRVRKGDALAVLENPELARQQQELQAQLAAKQQINDRLQSTHGSTPALVPLQQVEAAQAELGTIKARLSAVQDRLGFLQVRAPFDGIVTMRNVDEGATVQSGMGSSTAKTLFVVQAIDPVRVTFEAAGPDAARIRKGSTVRISFPDIVGEPIVATVSRTSEALDASSGTMRVEVDLPNPKGGIRPGMAASGDFEQQAAENVLSLPIAAQQVERGSFFIWLVKDGVVERVTLRKGLANKVYFEVLEPALDVGSQVIVEGRNQVKPGERVEAIEQK